MVTGSHIPDDRNGIKYNKATGEVLKDDELGMMGQEVELPNIFGDDGMLKEGFSLGDIDKCAEKGYLKRWQDVFPSNFLTGKKIGLYQHSAVGRDILYDITRIGSIGSPYVITEMANAAAHGGECVVGYEANGGFLMASDAMIFGKPLHALPTRDAVIVHLGIQ